MCARENGVARRGSGFTRHLSQATVRQAVFERLIPGVFWSVVACGAVVGSGGLFRAGTNWLILAHDTARVGFTLLVAVLFWLRRPALRREQRLPVRVLVAPLAMFLPLSMAVQPLTTRAPGLLAASTAIALAGTLWSLVSLAYLGRCFGILPDVRGLVTRGPYRLVRHPLYLGELVASLGIVLASFSPVTIALWVGLVCLQVWRATNEERALLSVFPEYSAYAKTTRRLVPFLW